MARTDNEKLVVELEARIRDFEKGMQRSAQTADRQFGKMQRSAKKSANDLESTMRGAATRINGVLGKIGVGGLIGTILGGGAVGIVSQFTTVTKGIASIGDAAKQAGLDAKSFQELAYVAKVNRIEVDTLTAGIREMQLRMDEFVTSAGKSGSAAEALGRLGFTVDDIRDKLKNPVVLLEQIIDRTKTLGQAARIKIFDDIFGGNGERIVRLIDQGAEGIRATIEEAHRLDAVLTDDVIKSADELDKKFEAIAQTVGNSLKRAIVEAAGALSSFIDSFNNFQDQQDSSLSAQLAKIGKQRMDLENNILKLQGEKRDSTGLNPFGRDYDSDIKYLQDERDALGETETQILAVTEARRKEKEARKPATTAPTFTPIPPKADRGAATKAVKSESDAVAELIARLEEELSLVNASDAAKRASAAARSAGAKATEDEKQKVIELTEAIYQGNAAREKAAEAIELQRDAIGNLFDMAGDALGSIADGSVKAEDAIKKLAIQLALAAAQAALLGTGPLAGLFGGGLGGSSFKPTAGGFAQMLGLPGFAGGTNYAPGGTAIVGERGPELVNLPRGSQVIPNINRYGSGPSSTTFQMHVSVSGNGDKELLDRVHRGTEIQMREALRNYDQQVLPHRVNQIAADPRAVG